METSITTELQEAIEKARHGERDAEAMRKASDRLDQTREAMQRKVGLVDIAVPAVRELRDE
jgi:hypothetical protein